MHTKESYRTRIATYNIGDFSGRDFEKGSEEAKTVIRRTMGKVGADLWALQEDVYWFGGVKDLDVYEAVYSDYPHYARQYTGDYNGKAFLSKTEVTDVERIAYVGEMRFGHPWYLRGHINMGGRDVWLYCLHFDWSDKHARAVQITELLADAVTREYCIILGDFNPENYENGELINRDLLYEAEFARFADAGFAAANTGAFGTFDTILDTDITPCPFDNIFVTPNITLENAGRVADQWMYDHALVWADIAVH